MKRIRLDIAYNGTRYFGWQRQNGFPTVQETIEDALSVILQEEIKIVGASRTDSGVHALGQVSHFDTNSPREVLEIKKILNKKLPEDIQIMDVTLQNDQFDARRSACGKHYQYRIFLGQEKPLFEDDFVYWHRGRRLDLELMKKSAFFFLGTHDFTSFGSNSGREDENKVREIRDIRISECFPRLTIDVFGTSFLYKMVRGICGTLLEIGLGKKHEIDQILSLRDRSFAGRNLPAKGLFLMEVFY